jgi:glycosyltransferase involved in cell wall biosynthesis
VVNDGSTDNSIQVLREHLTEIQIGKIEGLSGDPKCFFGSLPLANRVIVLDYDVARGPSFARNRGAEVAVKAVGAEVLAFLDSDDIYEQGKIRSSIQYFEDPSVGAVYSDYDTLRPDGLRVREFKPAYSRELLLKDCIVNMDSLVCAKTFFEIDGFDETLRVAEDYDLWIRLSEKRVIFHIPESLLTIRVGSHSSTDTVKSEIWNQCWQRVMQKTQERAKR